MRTLILISLVLLTGCSSIATMYDRADPCQMRAELGRPPGYERPSYCGAGSGRTYIYNNSNQRIGYVK